LGEARAEGRTVYRVVIRPEPSDSVAQAQRGRATAKKFRKYLYINF